MTGCTGLCVNGKSCVGSTTAGRSRSIGLRIVDDACEVLAQPNAFDFSDGKCHTRLLADFHVNELNPLVTSSQNYFFVLDGFAEKITVRRHRLERGESCDAADEVINRNHDFDVFDGVFLKLKSIDGGCLDNLSAEI